MAIISPSTEARYQKNDVFAPPEHRLRRNFVVTLKNLERCLQIQLQKAKLDSLSPEYGKEAARRRLHIVLLSQIYPPDLGGTATKARNLAVGLVANGHEVTVVASVPHYPEGKIPKKYRWKPLTIERNEGVTEVRVFAPPLPSRGFGLRLIHLVVYIIFAVLVLPSVRKPIAVFASNPQVLAAYPGLFYKAVHGCPLILNVDDLWPESVFDLHMVDSPAERRFGEALARIAYRRADVVTPSTDSYSEFIVSKYGVVKDKVRTIPSGVDLGLFNRESRRKPDSGLFTALYIGALSPAYDFETVVRAARSLRGENGIQFVIHGAGEMLHPLKDFVARSGINNVAVDSHIVSRREAATEMISADVLLLPLKDLATIDKGISSKLFEYQAASRPIICCSAHNAGEYVKSTSSGIVVNPGDYKALAAAVTYLQTHEANANEMGMAGRRCVEKRYGSKVIASQLLEVIGTARRSGASIIPGGRSD